MLNVSNEFRQHMAEDKRNFLPYATIILADGTELGTLDKAQIWQGGFKIDDGVTASGQFTIGGCVINKLTLVLNNIYDDFSEYDFDLAKIEVFVGLELSGGKIEKIQKGVFNVDNPKYDGALITLECLDNMYKFDTDYSNVKTPYPATIGTIVRDMCSSCGVTLETASFEGDDIVINERPDDRNLSCRQVLQYCCQRICKFARCDVYGRLVIGWFAQGIFERSGGLDGGIFDAKKPYSTGDTADGGSFNPWDTGDTYDGGTFEDQKHFHHLYSEFSLSVSTDDVIITGIRVTEEFQETEETKKATYLCGNEGYVIPISGNPFIPQGKAEEVATYLGQKLIGLRFRPMTGTFLGDPTIEAGDLAYVTDYKQRSYNCLITNLTFAVGDSMQASCDAETPRKNSSKRYSELTQAMAQMRRDTQQKISEYDRTVQEMTQLISQGFGMYFTPKKQEDGSTKWYMHDKPTIKESSYVCYLTSNGIMASVDGGTSWAVDKNGNALFNVLSVIGLHAEWITTGQFVVKDANGKITFLADKDTGEVQIVAKSFSLTSGDTIDSIAEDKAKSAADDALSSAKTYADGAASGAVNAQTQEDIFNKLTNGGKNKGIYMRDGELYINMTYLQSGALKIVKDGEVIFLADAENKRVEIVADTFSLSSGDTIGSIAEDKANNALSSAKSYTDTSVNDFISKTYDPKIAELQKQIDGQIESFYYDHAPALDNAPANGWTSDALKTRHEGDLFFDRKTGYAYRFLKEGSEWKWQPIQDTDITKALAQAAAAQDTADHKRRTFLTTPTPPYDRGDLWYGGPNSDVLVCSNSRESGSYVASDWGKQDKYIDQAAADKAASDAVNGQTQQDVFNRLTDGGKKQGLYLQNGFVYLNAEYMATGVLQSHDGETFYLDLDKGILRMKATELTISGQTVEDIAQSKASSAANTALASAKTYADNAAKNAVNGQTQQDIFNKLTGGGSSQGIFLQGGKLYLNAEYLSTGIIADKAGKNFWNLETGEFSLSSTVLEDAGNLLMDSEELSDTYWTHSGNVSRGYEDPEGGNKAIMLTPTNTDSFFSANSSNNRPIKSTGQGYTFSVWLKASKTSTFTISLNHIYGRKTITVGTAWKRYTISTEVSTISSSNQVTIGGWESLTSTSGNIYIYKPVVQYGHSSEVAFGQLTNNGAVQGLYMSNGNLYMNASYVQTGILNVKKKDGTSTFYANMDTGEVNIVATSFSLTSGKTIDSIAEDKAKSAADSALSNAKTYADGAASGAVNAQTQLSIFNKLTGGGAEQGIFLQDGRIYLNASYMSVSYLASLSANLGTITAGVLQSTDYGYSYSSDPYSSSGTQINLNTNTVRAKNFAIDASGNAYFKGSISGSAISGSTITGTTITSSGSGRTLRMNNGTLEFFSPTHTGVATNFYVVDETYFIPYGKDMYQESDAGVLYVNSQTAIKIVIDSYNVAKFDVQGIRFDPGSYGNGDFMCNIPASFYKGATFSESQTATFNGPTVFRSGAGTSTFYCKVKMFNLQTVTSGGHLVFGSDGSTVCYLSSSSERYKDIGAELSAEDVRSLYDIKVMWAKYKDGYLAEDDERNGVYMPMFIAEDVEQQFPLAVDHRDGLAENWNERVMIPAMMRLIQEQNRRITELEAKMQAIA